MANRRPQLRREETRALFIEAGRAILKENGLGAGGDVLTLKRARDRVEADFGVRFVNASLIGRIWKDQFDYQTEVLATIAADDSGSEIDASLDQVTSMLANLDVRSDVSRRWSLQEMCRVVSAVHLDTLRGSTDWALWIGILATTAVGSVPERQQRIDAALRKSYEDVTSQMEAIYSSLLEFIGFRVRTGFDGPPVRHRRRGPDRGLCAARPGRPGGDERDQATHGAVRRGPGVDVVRPRAATGSPSSSSCSTGSGSTSTPSCSNPRTRTVPPTRTSSDRGRNHRVIATAR